MTFQNIAGYQFVLLSQLTDLRSKLLTEAKKLMLKGTILLSQEGINISLSGIPKNTHLFKVFLSEDCHFAPISFRESYSDFQPFKGLKIKIKDEIITLKKTNIHPLHETAASITPSLFKQWLETKKELTVLDTRNDYEVRFGTFEGALNLKLKHFTDFPKKINQIPKDKPIVMFCTGGIRCEKAASVLMQEGYEEVYQLEGGILNYFAEVGGDYYNGECFVFDQRIAVDSHLKVSQSQLCKICQAPVKPKELEETYCLECILNKGKNNESTTDRIGSFSTE